MIRTFYILKSILAFIVLYDPDFYTAINVFECRISTQSHFGFKPFSFSRLSYSGEENVLFSRSLSLFVILPPWRLKKLNVFEKRPKLLHLLFADGKTGSGAIADS